MTEYRWIKAEPTDTKEDIRFWTLEFDEVGGAGGELLTALDPLPEPFSNFDTGRFYTREELNLLERLQPPQMEATDEGSNVWWEPPHYRPTDVEAVLPDGTRLGGTMLLGGRRLGFEERLPRGTAILVRGKLMGRTGGVS